MSGLQITSARTSRLDLPLLFPGQVQKEAFVNEALTRLDALIQASIISESATPPAEPSDGDSYIVAAEAIQGWAGRAGQLAIWAQNQWLFLIPPIGASVFDRSAESIAFYRGDGGWQRAGAPEPVIGGAVQDNEARDAIASIIAALRIAGIIS